MKINYCPFQVMLVIFFSLAISGCKSFQDVTKKNKTLSKEMLCQRMVPGKHFKIKFRNDSIVYIYITKADSNKIEGTARLNQIPSKKTTSSVFEYPTTKKTTLYTESFERIILANPVKVYEYKGNEFLTLLAIGIPTGFIIYLTSWDYSPNYYD